MLNVCSLTETNVLFLSHNYQLSAGAVLKNKKEKKKIPKTSFVLFIYLCYLIRMNAPIQISKQIRIENYVNLCGLAQLFNSVVNWG